MKCWWSAPFGAGRYWVIDLVYEIIQETDETWTRGIHEQSIGKDHWTWMPRVRGSKGKSRRVSVSTSSGSKTWQDTQSGRQRKVEKGSWLWGWWSQNTSEGSSGRMLRWFVHSPRNNWGHRCPEGTIKGAIKGSWQPMPKGGNTMLVWERIGWRVMWRNMVKANSRERLCDNVIRKEQWWLGCSPPSPVFKICSVIQGQL